MTYAESVRFLYSLGNEIQTAKFGLERITRLLDVLGNPHRMGRFVHVAGTNGKGSISAMIEAGLRSAGVRTGLYTSPHLIEPTERIQVAGQAITPDRFAEVFTEVHEIAQRMLQAGELDLHPTYFESVTAMAFLVFARERVETAVLEVGLGGRLDATNVVNPALAVITPIDFDHQIFLGDTLGKIAAEKAGILKPGVPAIFAEQPPEAEAVLRANAKGPYLLSRDWAIVDLELNARGSRFRLRGMEINCPLAGEHQVENARTAAIALHELGIPPGGIADTWWPGRLERVREQPEIILDGAHNPAGTRALVSYIRRFYKDRRIWIVYGVMRDKAVAEMVEMLFPLANCVIVTAPANSRAMPPESIPAPGVVITHTVDEAVAQLGHAQPKDAIFITGSLFVVGEARALLIQ
ncbi:MAG TPA: folylpolyglutamate synthase/dihydrofolate synthase family protein [Bryobacteraceae bacterium]|jgi:dihydrofolate synthase/folylpolyglutamate synthase|nr:folylpolyglutamate synthase/dihydrofolate synthase family protein [Bryobacteraceae bacterium]